MACLMCQLASSHRARLTMSVQIVIELLSKRLWIVQKLQCREVGLRSNTSSDLLPFLTPSDTF